MKTRLLKASQEAVLGLPQGCADVLKTQDCPSWLQEFLQVRQARHRPSWIHKSRRKVWTLPQALGLEVFMNSWRPAHGKGPPAMRGVRPSWIHESPCFRVTRSSFFCQNLPNKNSNLKLWLTGRKFQAQNNQKHFKGEEIYTKET